MSEANFEQDLFLQERTTPDGSGRDIVSISRNTLDLNALIEQARSSSAGAVSTFFGTTRDTFEGKDVTHLEYEAYPEMALSSMLEICAKAREQWPILTMIMQHKLGACPISDVSIAIIVSSVHRKESLAAVNYAINELKDKVPIWKKEFYNEGDSKWKDNKEDAALVAANNGK